MNKMLVDLLDRAKSWPESAQEELAQVAREIEAALGQATYRATPEELAGIDRGLRAAAEGRFATDEEVEAVFAKYRRA
jgi:predicted transcriptional regulator